MPMDIEIEIEDYHDAEEFINELEKTGLLEKYKVTIITEL